MELDVSVRRLFAELAYIACMSNDVTRARRILDGLAAVAADSPETAIGYAVADMTMADFGAAIARLRPFADDGDPHATVLLGVALKLVGRASECEAVLARMPKGDPAADALAGALR